MDNKALRLERQERILRAMRHEKNDRTPLMFAGDNALIRYIKPETTYGYMIREHNKMTETIIEEVLPLFPKVDMMCAVGVCSKFIGAPYLAKTYLPGKELPENTMWQPIFEDIMTEEDYDYVIRHGWQKFQEICWIERLGFDMDEMMEDMESGARNKALYSEAGLPFMEGELLPAPFDTLAFGRGIMDFFIDLYERPEQILEIMNIMMDEYEAANRDRIAGMIQKAKACGEEMMYTIIPCVQANCNMIGRDGFEKFGWPLFERQANFILELGGLVNFHMDQNWTDCLDLFKVFPKGKCFWDTDGETDMEKLRDILGDRMAISGCVPPAIMAFGTPEEVYKEARKEIEMMGDCFVLAPSCTLPANMPKENVDALYAAIE